MSENCENCGKVIGDLETPHLYKTHVVCSICIQKLQHEESDSESLIALSMEDVVQDPNLQEPEETVVGMDPALISLKSDNASANINLASPMLSGSSPDNSQSGSRLSVASRKPISSSDTVLLSSSSAAGRPSIPQIFPVIAPVTINNLPVRAPLMPGSGPLEYSPKQNNAPGYMPTPPVPVVIIKTIGLVGMGLGYFSLFGALTPFLSINVAVRSVITGVLLNIGITPRTFVLIAAIAGVLGLVMGIVGLQVGNLSKVMPNRLSRSAIGVSIVSLLLLGGQFAYTYSQMNANRATISSYMATNTANPQMPAYQTNAQVRQQFLQNTKQFEIPNIPQPPTFDVITLKDLQGLDSSLLKQQKSIDDRREKDMEARLNRLGLSMHSGSANPTPPVPQAPIKQLRKLDVSGEGSAVVDDVTFSYVSMQTIGVAVRPRDLSGSGAVLAISMRITLSVDARIGVQLDNPRMQPMLTIKGESASANFIPSDPESVTILPGKSLNVIFYFPYPSTGKNVDMAITLPGSIFEDSMGTIKINLPKGGLYRPARSSATTQPASINRSIHWEGLITAWPA